MIKTWLGAWLAAALLGAWQGALLHPLEHLDEHGHFVHLGGVDGSDTRGENERQDGPFNPSDKLGDLLAAVAACVSGDSSIAITAFHGGEAPDSGKAEFPSRPPLLAYRSQAPPSLL